MKGVVLLGNRNIEIRKFPNPKPSLGQVLIKMKASGLCGSDLSAIYRPKKLKKNKFSKNVIAGHEPCGEIIEIGHRFFVRCLFSTYISCG